VCGGPSAFFSVCLSAADDTEESRAATRGYIDDFVERWAHGFMGAHRPEYRASPRLV
jgi:menaquinone-dependent protoporphyrinogen IX oxidase